MTRFALTACGRRIVVMPAGARKKGERPADGAILALRQAQDEE
jgi:hypothetical protein